MRLFILAVLITTGLYIQSQDTLRLMQYNLLMYGDDYGGCNQSNNNVADKNEYLKTILTYVKPDIFAVNELDKDAYYSDLILNNVFNINGIDYYKRAYPPNVSNGFTINNVFYDSRKLELTGVSIPVSIVRDINIFKFKYIFGEFADSNILLNFTVAHLKAGDDYAGTRASETSGLMQYLVGSAPGNYTLSGDLNLYTSSEQAFQNLLFYPEESVRFYDPVNRIGSWNENPNFADVHTQSTHMSGGCPSSGGLDDRFDFILVSDEILNSTDNVKYAENSYWTIGQDGLHYNNSLLSNPTNTSVPANVLSALYAMSDHLPVVIDLVIGGNTGVEEQASAPLMISYKNPVQRLLTLHYRALEKGEYQITLCGMLGKVIYTKRKILSGNGNFDIDVSNAPSGIYMLQAVSGSGKSYINKVIISD